MPDQSPAVKRRMGASWRQTFSSLKVPNYRLYFTGQSISLAGTWMQMTAQSGFRPGDGCSPPRGAGPDCGR